jgi:hypothetical protein
MDITMNWLKKTLRFTIGHYDFSIDFRAKREWNDFKVFKSEGTRHIVWGRLSILVENWFIEIHPVCAQCGSWEINETWARDEGWTICQSCRSIEGGYNYVNLREYEKLS